MYLQVRLVRSLLLLLVHSLQIQGRRPALRADTFHLGRVNGCLICLNRLIKLIRRSCSICVIIVDSILCLYALNLVNFLNRLANLPAISRLIM